MTAPLTGGPGAPARQRLSVAPGHRPPPLPPIPVPERPAGPDAAEAGETALTRPFPGPPEEPTVHEPVTTPSQGLIRRATGAAFEAIARVRTYAFSLDEGGLPIELGSGRFAKAYLGEERWLQSKTAFRRPVAIKVLQKGVSHEDQLRFALEKEILEHVQGHPNIVEILASGESDEEGFIPEPLRDRLENDFMVLEVLDMSLEEWLKGSRGRGYRDDLLAAPPRERIFRALEYVLPVALAVEFAHLERDTCHRDIKPANVLLRMPSPRLRGARLEVKLADFNVGKTEEVEGRASMTHLGVVPGTLYFQSPEQETNVLELLVNTTRGEAEVEYFEDFYTEIDRNDCFSLYNREERYRIMGADRERKRLLLDRPWAEPDERNVRARVLKAVGRPADIYSLGALLYYLVSGAYANPKTLYDAFRTFIEYDGHGERNTVTSYLEHEYGVIRSLRAPRPDGDSGGVDLAPEDRFFSYKHYLDGNGELIDQVVMLIVARAMIRTKPDSYCRAWDLQTEGISSLVSDLMALYLHYGVDPEARVAYPMGRYDARKAGLLRRVLARLGGRGA